MSLPYKTRIFAGERLRIFDKEIIRDGTTYKYVDEYVDWLANGPMVGESLAFKAANKAGRALVNKINSKAGCVVKAHFIIEIQRVEQASTNTKGPWQFAIYINHPASHHDIPGN